MYIHISKAFSFMHPLPLLDSVLYKKQKKKSILKNHNIHALDVNDWVFRSRLLEIFYIFTNALFCRLSSAFYLLCIVLIFSYPITQILQQNHISGYKYEYLILNPFFLFHLQPLTIFLATNVSQYPFFSPLSQKQWL